jgi:hypothetical protein
VQHAPYIRAFFHTTKWKSDETMKIRFIPLLILSLIVLPGCSLSSLKDETVYKTEEAPTPRIVTPIPPLEGYLDPLASSNIARVWANTGEDKITRDELRASLNPSSVLNSVWNGTGITLFGGRNEVVAFNLILEAPAADATYIEMRIDSLAGPEGASITTSAGEGSDPFDYLGRNIELFYVRYLEINGISTDLFFAGYDYDERHIPERCRRPLNSDGEGVGDWSDRPCHNLFYPEIAVPLELHFPFDIPAGMNQSIWGDIYIPKATPPGEYSGTIAIQEDGVLTWEIPILLQVRNFTLPDLPSARTMLYVSLENIGDRYLGEAELIPGTAEYDEALLLMDRHFQLAHRHKISLIDDYLPVEQMEAVWGPRLNGQLFTADNGYDGIGVGVGNNVYSIGTYGSWPWQNGTRTAMWEYTNAWVDWFESRVFNTSTEYFLYLIDESDDYQQTEEWAEWIDNNPGLGKGLKSMATLDLPDAVVNVPSLDIPASWARFGVTAEWQAAVDEYKADSDKLFYLYNSNRPATGSFAIEDEGVALRQLPWAQFKMRVDRWFYWEGTYYSNYQCYGDSEEVQTNVFERAQTYGCLEKIDTSLGETGWNYLNGDGVLFYPGTDIRFPEESYGVMGPFASLRLKHWRRGIQDVDYLTMAAQIDPERTEQIVQEMIPVVLWEVGVTELEDPTYVYADISWPTDPDAWEAARAELAEIIESTLP